MSSPLESWLAAIAILLLMILIQVWAIAKRTRERFPTEKEQDSDWVKSDPMGHWEAHKNDRKGK